MTEGLFHLLSKLLDFHNYQIDYKEFKIQLLGHPNYPSLQAIKGVFDHFRIDNAVFQVDKDSISIEQLPLVFLGTLLEGGQYVLVEQNKDHVILNQQNKSKSTLSREEFLEAWSGVILAIEFSSTHAPKTTYKGNPKTVFGVICLLILLITLGFSNAKTFEWTNLLLSFVGCAFATLIIRLELGLKSNITDKVCQAGESTSCEAVLKSSGSTIFKGLEMSDVSLIYFWSILFSGLVIMSFGGNYFIVSALSVLALPVTIYTLYFQIWVVKKWCPLCLGITSVLWLQFFSLSPYLNGGIYQLLTPSSAIVLLNMFGFGVFWLSARPLLLQNKELKATKIQYLRIKRDFDLFYSHYLRSPKYDLGVLPGEIHLGNTDGAVQLVLFTNPSCRFCHSAHNVIEKLLSQYGDRIGVRFRFNTPSNRESTARLICTKLIEIYSLAREDLPIAIREAFKQDFTHENWLKKWGYPEYKELSKSLLRSYKQWCENNEVHFTPALLINNKIYPKVYEVKDLEFFIEELIECSEAEIPIGIEKMALQN